MENAILAWPFICLLVAGSQLPGHALQLGILQHNRDVLAEGRYSLDAVAVVLKEWGYTVDVMTVDQQSPFWEAGVMLEHDLNPIHQAILAQGKVAKEGVLPMPA